jgi:hypothetical protein
MFMHLYLSKTAVDPTQRFGHFLLKTPGGKSLAMWQSSACVGQSFKIESNATSY